MSNEWRDMLWEPIVVDEEYKDKGGELASSKPKSFYDVQPLSEQYRMLGVYPEKKILDKGIRGSAGGQ